MSGTESVRARRPWWLRASCLVPAATIVILLVGGLWIYLSLYQGRDISRVTGIPVKVALPACVKRPEQVISVSFHSKASGETTKDVTYTCDGRLFSHEYNDFGILEGTVEWTFTP